MSVRGGPGGDGAVRDAVQDHFLATSIALGSSNQRRGSHMRRRDFIAGLGAPPRPHSGMGAVSVCRRPWPAREARSALRAAPNQSSPCPLPLTSEPRTALRCSSIADKAVLVRPRLAASSTAWSIWPSRRSRSATVWAATSIRAASVASCVSIADCTVPRSPTWAVTS
jgi:hypothetical protein